MAPSCLSTKRNTLTRVLPSSIQSGEKIESVRKDAQAILRIMVNIYPASKLFVHVMDVS
jgi:hypothetical protein